jgi:hypothetical protein
MGPGRNAAKNRIGGINVEAFAGAAAREQSAGKTVGECRLADALGSGDQPGMVQPAAGAGLGPNLLGRFMTEQIGIGPRL